ncbi:bacterial translation initiation factor 2 (bIF-2) [Halothece sp. PCC 7418]|uniref:translation initiation factor IF-2 n=1 Tax=Halothece sp. (strain PCC 7418) TaxID=65093 RepID=UPI0002A0660A|nr:translation initiation factor IF-2 [Halothece sp. PCC 7418]AFZ44555.1 bacterial translation initiation factor 2 (bIF-2) [Halothece sp. PCC 7418]
MTKVRIYDLSRELDLENKQVLDICNKLNITAKTHSSSIPEEDAERIRADVQKGGVSKNYDNGNGKANPRNGKPSKKHQQKILEVRHNKREEGKDPHGKNGDESGDGPQLKAPPRRPTAKSDVDQDIRPKPKMKKTAQETPSSVSPDTSETTENLQKPVAGSEGSVQKQAEKPKAPEAKPSPSVKSEAPAPTEANLESSASSESKELIGPPSKPKPPKKEGKKVEKPKKPEKPTLKSPKPKPEPAPEKAEPAPEAKTEEKPAPKKPAKPKMLAKPKRAADQQAPPKDEDQLGKTAKEEETSEEETSDDNELLLEQPKRPRPKRVEAPTRTGKKKGWEEEEEDTEKVEAKAQPKKRRPKPIIEDDDDEELALENELDQPEQDSIALRSLERPPKPEALQKKATTPQPKAAPSKPKKNRGGSQPSTQRTQRQEKEQSKERPETITLTQELAVPALAELLAVSETEIIKNLFFKGIQVNITQTLEIETARMVAEDLGVNVEIPEEKSAATKTEMLDTEDLENLQSRPPVITIMGHVDHGKTSLLDSIRKTKVAEGEAGGITQHTGAYHVDVDHEGETKQVVFLDTPGHEAFTAMRARGAKVTDIAVLVVAADDGVQPQTQEAISHAKAAGVPIVVAINKMDKEGAQPDRVKQELTEHELVPEEWGGNTPMVGVSAITGDNLDELLEMIILVAELEELSANPDRLAKGTVIEANLDRARGPVATLLVQNGTLRIGDVIVAGPCFGKIRAMIDDRGERVEVASPSFAVEILGLSEVPSAGDEFAVYKDEKEARAIAEQRTAEMRSSRLQRAASSRRVTLSNVSEQAQEGELKELNLIIKADVQGSVEAIQSSLAQLPQNEVQIRVLYAAPGEVTETDVDLAAASGAVIIGFNTTLASNTKAAADKEGVDIREYDIIYKLLDEIQGAMEGLLDPEEVESPLGTAEVRAVFPVGRGSVAGCYVQSGRIVRNRQMRVRRDGEVVYQGNIDSLKRVKEDAKEVQSGFECGIGSNKFNNWKEGDIIEAYEMVMKRRTLNPKK